MIGCPLCGCPHSDETNRIGGKGVLAREAQQQPEQQAAEKQERQRLRLTWHGRDYSGNPGWVARPFKPDVPHRQSGARPRRCRHPQRTYPDTE
jgi:hypothetical protein